MRWEQGRQRRGRRWRRPRRRTRLKWARATDRLVVERVAEAWRNGGVDVHHIVRIAPRGVVIHRGAHLTERQRRALYREAARMCVADHCCAVLREAVHGHDGGHRPQRVHGESGELCMHSLSLVMIEKIGERTRTPHPPFATFYNNAAPGARAGASCVISASAPFELRLRRRGAWTGRTSMGDTFAGRAHGGPWCR
jgi:hypothetical protein